MKEIVDQTIGAVLDPSPDFNGFKNEVQNAIISGGISLSEADVNQLGKSIANYVGNADYYACTGSANTYTLSRVGLFKEPSGYFTGMRIRFRPNVSNTGASTVNIVGLGVKDLKRTDGTTDFASGELSNLYDYEFTYNGTVFSLQSQGVIEGNVSTDLIQTKTASGDITVKNQAGTEIAKFANNGFFYADAFATIYNSCTVPASSYYDITISNPVGIILFMSFAGGSTSHQVGVYVIGSSASTAGLTLLNEDKSSAYFSVAYQSGSGASSVFRITNLTASDLNVYYDLIQTIL